MLRTKRRVRRRFHQLHQKQLVTSCIQPIQLYSIQHTVQQSSAECELSRAPPTGLISACNRRSGRGGRPDYRVRGVYPALTGAAGHDLCHVPSHHSHHKCGTSRSGVCISIFTYNMCSAGYERISRYFIVSETRKTIPTNSRKTLC